MRQRRKWTIFEEKSARFPCQNANLPHCTYFTHVPPPNSRKHPPGPSHPPRRTPWLHGTSIWQSSCKQKSFYDLCPQTLQEFTWSSWGRSVRNLGPAPLQKFCQGLFWRIFLGTFSHKNNQRKTKGQQLKGKIVSALFHTFWQFSTHFHTFSEFFRIFPPRLFLRIKGFYCCFSSKIGKENKRE